MLDDINLTIEPGQTVGIIGFRLRKNCPCFHDTPALCLDEREACWLDGVDVRDYSLKNLKTARRHGASEKMCCFWGQSKENLMWEDEDASEEKRSSRIRGRPWPPAFLRTFPDGWRDPAGTGRVNVSGGPRLCIARGAPEKARILIWTTAPAPWIPLRRLKSGKAYRCLNRKLQN